MSTKKLFLTVLLLCPLCFNAYAEKITVEANEPPTLSEGAQTPERTIKGQVVDIEGEPLIGAAVLIKGTTKGTTTDFEGKFTLGNVTDATILEFSSIGYQTQYVTLGSQAVLNVVLTEDSQLIDEVVVVGYGTMRRSLVTSAISKVGVNGIRCKTLCLSIDVL